MTATKVSRVPHSSATAAPWSGFWTWHMNVSFKLVNSKFVLGLGGGLTTSRKTLFRVAQTRIKIPALRTIVVAIFLMSLRLDFQSMGIGMKMRYGSVIRFAAKVTPITGLAIAGWHTSSAEAGVSISCTIFAL